MRRFFTDAWHKFKNNQPLEPLEQLVAQIIKQHPEYHRLMETPEKMIEHDFLPEDGQTNPFLHLSMHIGITEQISTDRPTGIAQLYQQLMTKTQDAHETEHQIMECLGRMLWEAQRNNQMPDEAQYLECIRKLL